MARPNYDVEVFARRLDGWGQIDSASDADYMLELLACGGEIMRFRLTYAGPLKSAGKNPRAAEKASIRHAIASQLYELARVHPVFTGIGLTIEDHHEAHFEGGLPRVIGSPVHIRDNQHRTRLALTAPIVVDGRPFTPLVRKSLRLTCGLDILFMRKEGPSAPITSGGDLDNRIKVLFDALRVPKPGEDQGEPMPDNLPMWCLLEDDALISGFAVRTDWLLSSPNSDPADVLLVIEVVVQASRLTTENIGFLGV